MQQLTMATSFNTKKKRAIVCREHNEGIGEFLFLPRRCMQKAGLSFRHLKNLLAMDQPLIPQPKETVETETVTASAVNVTSGKWMIRVVIGEEVEFFGTSLGRIITMCRTFMQSKIAYQSLNSHMILTLASYVYFFDVKEVAWNVVGRPSNSTVKHLHWSRTRRWKQLNALYELLQMQVCVSGVCA